ncbi:hypothetical protein Pcinc_004230 [Petrolisthes cinctipes]|uniref:Neurotransmitter-gated ion-channel ligand-binding domain-containing protein n=1 Tax=Petrolisthes cinctipes TaxID=88211 RepID=A0AAE1L0H9_PETCI|nr:hypothetical protein Pcinc_008782 [Petrolisthes cinctipes]KAK3891916.1 hypothetical protein Pcinc_004222 [Petrolisthes cinctipes]KAK3891924.1 hypothetical protein Pcinc_004230 [Petrolisthes cinctipes]
MFKTLVGEPQQPSLSQFSQTVVTQLLQKFGQVTQTIPPRHSDTLPDRGEPWEYLDRHFMEHLPLTDTKSDYQRHLPPRLSGSDEMSLPIILMVTVETIAVKTVDMTMEVAYEISLSWVDPRLKYLNLKANPSLNKLHVDTVQRLWIPQVNFINTDNIHRTEIDVDVVMFIRKLSKEFIMDERTPSEVCHTPSMGEEAIKTATSLADIAIAGRAFPKASTLPSPPLSRGEAYPSPRKPDSPRVEGVPSRIGGYTTTWEALSGVEIPSTEETPREA